MSSAHLSAADVQRILGGAVSTKAASRIPLGQVVLDNWEKLFDYSSPFEMRNGRRVSRNR
jgi:hypothetical protein